MLAPSVLGSAHDIVATASAASAKYTIRDFCWKDDISGLPRKQTSYPRGRADNAMLARRADAEIPEIRNWVFELRRLGVHVRRAQSRVAVNAIHQANSGATYDIAGRSIRRYQTSSLTGPGAAGCRLNARLTGSAIAIASRMSSSATPMPSIRSFRRQETANDSVSASDSASGV